MTPPTHGGHRTPGPGKRLGRPRKGGITIIVKVRCTTQAQADMVAKLTPEQRGEMMTGENKMAFNFGTQIDVVEQRDHNEKFYGGKWQAREGAIAVLKGTEQEAIAWLQSQGVEPVREENYWQM